MYQLAPISLKPEVRASRSQHGQFQRKLEIVTAKVEDEKEVLDMNNEDAKLLFSMMDKFFSYGLFSGDQSYWRFVREFLPKTEQSILKAEWGDVNDRRLSQAWLKDAFNKGTLSFQMMAFRCDKKAVIRYYHPNACMVNGGMLEAVTEMMERLVTVQFAFYARNYARLEPARAAVVNPPSAQSAAALKAKTRQELEQSGPVVPNLANPDPIDIVNAGDQDVLLDTLVRAVKSRIRFPSGQYSYDREELHAVVPSHKNPVEPAIFRESIDDVIKKTMSQVNLDHLNNQRTFETMLEYDEEHQKPKEETVEGEDFITPADALQLTMHVFVDQGEKLIKMYHVFDRFAVGVPARRLLGITKENMYILSKTLAHADNADGLEGQSSSIFFAHCIIPLDSLDSIDISFDYQQICFYAKKDSEFTFLEGVPKEQFISIGTGDKALGLAILSSIENTYKSYEKKLPSILLDESPHTLILMRYLEKEFTLAPSAEIQHLSLVYWKESAATAQQTRMDHSGYLFWRFNQANWWRRPQSEFEQCYFHLRQDRKLYIFRDSSMKEGIHIYDLRTCKDTLEMDQRKDYQWSFELVFPEGNLQLLSQSKDDLTKWMQLISGALTCSDEVDASAAMCILTETHLVVAQEGSKCITDGFVRTLVAFPLNEIKEGWVVCGGQSAAHLPHSALVLRVDNCYEWLFFRTEHELDRTKAMLGKYPMEITEIQISSSHSTRDTAVIMTAAQRCPELWGNPIYDADAAEVYEN